jgi:hypothetical protein
MSGNRDLHLLCIPRSGRLWMSERWYGGITGRGSGKEFRGPRRADLSAKFSAKATPADAGIATGSLAGLPQPSNCRPTVSSDTDPWSAMSRISRHPARRHWGRTPIPTFRWRRSLRSRRPVLIEGWQLRCRPCRLCHPSRLGRRSHRKHPSHQELPFRRALPFRRECLSHRGRPSRRGCPEALVVLGRQAGPEHRLCLEYLGRPAVRPAPGHRAHLSDPAVLDPCRTRRAKVQGR